MVSKNESQVLHWAQHMAGQDLESGDRHVQKADGSVNNKFNAVMHEAPSNQRYSTIFWTQHLLWLRIGQLFQQEHLLRVLTLRNNRSLKRKLFQWFICLVYSPPLFAFPTRVHSPLPTPDLDDGFWEHSQWAGFDSYPSLRRSWMLSHYWVLTICSVWYRTQNRLEICPKQITIKQLNPPCLIPVDSPIGYLSWCVSEFTEIVSFWLCLSQFS